MSKARESVVLEQFLPVRPEIQQLWDRNILPSLPASPQKSIAHSVPYGSYKQTVFQDIANESVILRDHQHQQYDAMQGLPKIKAFSPTDTSTQSGYRGGSNTSNSSHSPYTPNATPTSPLYQQPFIDKRRHRKQDSMAMLEVALQDRSQRESLFELGILKMSRSPSCSPSPPPLSVIYSANQNAPDFASIYNNVHDQKAPETPNGLNGGHTDRGMLYFEFVLPHEVLLSAT